MASSIKVWIDPEGDFLEVVLEPKEGVFEYEESGVVNVKRDVKGKVVAFHILGVGKLSGGPIEVELKSKETERAD